MEDMASLWSYQERNDEMKQKFLCTSLEFDQFKAEISEEIKKKSEYVKQLIQIVKKTCHERDEARDQIQKLLKKIMLSTIKPHQFFSIPTESNSLSEAYNYNSGGSSPVDSFLDAVSSPEFSNINMADSSNLAAFVNQSVVPDCNPKLTSDLVSMDSSKSDHALLVIDGLVKGRPLPQKGKLLQAVIDTPPLLQSLLVAGPIPKWCNPPKHQPLPVPPFSIEGSDTNIHFRKSTADMSHGTSRSLNTETCGSYQILSAPMFGFASSGSCLGSDRLIFPGVNFNNLASLSKRQRLQ